MKRAGAWIETLIAHAAAAPATVAALLPRCLCVVFATTASAVSVSTSTTTTWVLMLPLLLQQRPLLVLRRLRRLLLLLPSQLLQILVSGSPLFGNLVFVIVDLIHTISKIMSNIWSTSPALLS